MQEEQLCRVDGCNRPAYKAGLCNGHNKRKRLGQTVNEPLTDRPTSKQQRLCEAALRFADASSEDEREYLLARDNLRKAASAFGQMDYREFIRESITIARENGSSHGRPRSVDPVTVARMFNEIGGLSEVAARLRVSRKTVYRALKLAGTKSGFCPGEDFEGVG